MRVTRKHIAQQVGVSVSTAGMILDGYGERYSAKTRAKVLDAAKALNYRPNLLGRSLRTGKSFLLGVLLYDGNKGLFSEFLRGVMKTLAGQEYSPIVFSHSDTAEEAEALRRCLHRQVDGLIANVAVNPDGTADTARCLGAIRQGLPVVEVFGHFLRGVPSVNIDNAAATRAAVQHLMDLGHCRIAMLTHERYRVSRGKRSGQHFDAWERYQGYARALREAGHSPMVFTHSLGPDPDTTDTFFAGGQDALDQLRSHRRKPTAVVCYSDLEAFGLIRACRVRQVAVPYQLSICGFGDLELTRIVSPSLTTLSVPAFDIGRAAAAALLDRVESRESANALLAPSLVVRESSAAPPG